ncbi:MAG: Rpn family recombination-promoting nuclease/putative transposase, partial [Verrucomicrobiota bacterium]|nr:Rpn family recombination-promoting nuclease/putative transposase [Verrucomicrobiota bacterium]
GRTDFRGIHTHDTLKLSARQRAVFLGEEAGAVFPEYFVLRVNDFDQAAVTPLDEWIRFLKTEEIPEGSKAPGLAVARERLIEARLTPEERLAYERAVHYRRIKQAE